MKFSPLLSNDWRGKIGNQVAAKARGGIQYLRELVVPKNPRTFLQSAIRAAVSAVASYWTNNLTQEEREQWANVATGQQTGGTRFSLVNNPRRYSLNTNFFTAITGGDVEALQMVDVPPPAFSTEFTKPELLIDASDGQLRIGALTATDAFIADATDAAPAIIYVFVSPPQSPSRFARQHAYRFARGLTLGDPPLNAAPYLINLAPLGMTPTAGQVMYVKIRAQHPDGALSELFEERLVVVA